MRVGISYWGFCQKYQDCTEANTPDGNRYGRPLLIDALRAAGHTIIALQQKREMTPYPGLRYEPDAFPDIDVLFVEWRWPTWKNSGDSPVEPDLRRQDALLSRYHGKIPIILWDTDQKMTVDDETKWPLAVIADPALDPIQLTRPRARLTFWSDFTPLHEPSAGSVEFGYIGNNYERDDMFTKYYHKPALHMRDFGVQTTVYGNWLQRSPERSPPETIVRKYSNVAFVDRVSFYDSMKILNKFICTVHITKDHYAKQGFVSPRYLENLVCNTPALVPIEFMKNDILGNEWTVDTLLDVVYKVFDLRKLTAAQRGEVVASQRESLLRVHDFDVKNVVSFIEEASRSSVGSEMKNL